MVQKIDQGKFRLDTGTGYIYAYEPTHPLANLAGKVYEHRYVVWLRNGGSLGEDLHVHHIDFDRANNESSNLQEMSAEEHIKLHKGEFTTTSVVCARCGITFGVDPQRLKRSCSGKVFCSKDCNKLYSRRFEVNREDLHKMVWTMPTVEVAKLFGVSDKAIEKRCKLLGVEKPPRGFWAKQRSK